jgi:hypothetical protein
MRTSFTLSADGRLTAVTNTRTGVQLAGFTGGASIVLLTATSSQSGLPVFIVMVLAAA